MLHCLRRAPRLTIRAQRAAFSTAATDAPRNTFKHWETIYYRGLAACSVGACALIGYGAATRFIELDMERSGGDTIGELVQAVADCNFKTDGSNALFKVSSHYCVHSRDF
jgi:hypothetical protein